MRRDAGQRGFTLLEVLIAFAIAALALGVMFDAVLGGLRATRTASGYQEAISLAKSHLAAITNSNVAGQETQGADGRGFTWKLHVVPVGTVTLARNADFDPADAPALQATLYAVSVTVLWKTDGGERQVRLDTARVASGQAKGG
jgi:general secretion pathway protein I